MRPFQYHSGQREVQREANSVPAADKLSTWVGPVVNFAELADLVIMASLVEGTFRVAALSGPGPLVSAESSANGILVSFPAALGDVLGIGHPWGGIVINPAQARRSRFSGLPAVRGNAVELPCEVAFTNCRKYMAPTASEGTGLLVGPAREEALPRGDSWVINTIATAETSFLVTATPSLVADVSHRGGRPGYLRYDASGAIEWTEYVGDGMFVSTGNVRQSPACALIVLELATGHALRLDLEATYTNFRADRHERVAALLQGDEPFPVQGRMHAEIRAATRLTGFCHPRRRVEKRESITSADTVTVQHPQ